MRNLHQVVIHDICKVICRQCISALVEYLIIQSRCINLNVATNQVIHLNNLVLGHLKTYNPDITACDALLYLLSRERKRCGQLLAHRVVVCEGLALLLGLLAKNFQLLRCVECVVSPAGINELLCVLEIDLAALALAIGSVRTTYAHTLVNLDAAPFERLNDIILGTRYETLRVGILDTQDHFTTVAASKQIVVKCCTNTAHMQGTCGARCETYSYLS